MERPSTSPQICRFGPFELSRDAAELRKNGIHLKLQDQPFQVLCTLLDHPGELVTRDQLQQQLWPDGTFVDFEHGLNTAIKKLRDVLNDDADNPRYIETIPRKGYRFIGAVGNEPAPAPVAPAPSDAYHWRKLIALGLIIAATTAGYIYFISRPRMLLVTKTKQLTFGGDIDTYVNFPGDFFSASVQTDGRRVYYTKLQDRIFSVPAEGGEEASIYTSLRHPTLLHISPDGSSLLVRSLLGSSADMESRLWIVATNGGFARPLGDIEARSAAWSRDGKSIAFAKGNAVYVTSDEGASFHKLFDVPGIASFVRWAPDGQCLRFTAIDPKTRVSSLWEGRLGSAARQLSFPFKEPGFVCCGDWSRDGRYFFFSRFYDQRFDYWYIDEGRLRPGSQTPVLLTTGGFAVNAATASPLGSRLFIVGIQHSTSTFRYDLHSRRLSPFMPDVEAVAVRFSPDGKWMNFLQRRNQQSILWRARADGSEWLQLTDEKLYILLKATSSDDKEILLMAKWPDRPWRLYIVSSQGGSLRELPIPIASLADPNWTPDGQSIVFGQPPRYLAEPNTPRAIYTYNLHTRELAKIAGTEGWFSPRLSRDGRQLLALSIDQRKLGVLDLVSLRWGILLKGTERDFFSNPFWSPDQTWAYLAVIDDEGEALVRIRLRDGLREEVFHYREVTGTLDCAAGPSLFNDNESVMIGCVRPDVNVYSLDYR